MIRNIQGLRAFAAVIVVFVHLRELLAPVGLTPFGAGGVDLFFVISGFVMVHTTMRKPPSALAFARNRIARIAPIYWLMTLSVFAVALLVPSLLGSTRADGVQLLKSLLFIPFAKANGLVEPVLFVGWTLNYEMFFYGLFAIGLTLGHYRLGLAGVVAVLTVLVAFGLVFKPLGVAPRFYTNPIMLEFALGMGVALLTEAAPKAGSTPMKAAAWATLLMAPVIVALPQVFQSSLIGAGIPSAILVAGVVLLERWGSSLSWRPVLAIGDASYILYLSHPYVTQTVQKLAARLHGPPVLFAALVVGCLALVVVTAVILHRFVEGPLSRAARRLLEARRMKPRPA